MEALLTVEEFAQRTHQNKETIRRQIKRGAIATVRTGRRYLIPESVLTPTKSSVQAPQARAAHLLAEMRSGDPTRRLRAIREMFRSDAQTRELIEAETQRAEAAYTGPQDDMSDWRALDSEPFHFSDEAPHYLEGLYRAERDAKSEGNPL